MSPASDHVFVVPAYGDSPFLDGCLATLAAQTAPSRIVITTSTPSAHIEAAAGRAGVPVIVNPARAGIAVDWNFALGVAGARLVTLAHQDDTYEPDFLASTLKAFQIAPAALCFTGYQEIDDDGAPVSSKVSKAKHLIELLTLGRAEVVSGLRLRAFLSFGDPLPCSSVTFAMDRLPGFAFSDAYAAVLDWDAWWRLMQAGETFVRAPGRLVGRRHNPLTETSRLIKAGVRRREDLAMFRRAWPGPLAELIALAYRAGY